MEKAQAGNEGAAVCDCGVEGGVGAVGGAGRIGGDEERGVAVVFAAAQGQAGRTTWYVLAADASGAMYGGLDLAEAVRLNTLDKVTDADRTPYVGAAGDQVQCSAGCADAELFG